MVRKPHCGPMSRYFWWPFEWPFAMDLRRWINQTYHPLLDSNGQFKPVQNGYSGQFTEPPAPYPLTTVAVVLKHAFIGVLEVTAAQERIAIKAVRNRGYLLPKTLKTHYLAFTAMFRRPLGQRLISGWLLMFVCQNNDLCNRLFRSVFCKNEKRLIERHQSSDRRCKMRQKKTLNHSAHAIFHTINLPW